MTRVAVVIPAYNAEPTLDATLRSVRAQTWRDLEILVVDDGSQDATAAIAERHAAEDPRVRVLRKKNGGAAAARNDGIAQASAPLIAPCDADDLWHPEKLARQVRRMEEIGPRCGFVYTLSRTMDAEDRITGHNGYAEFEGPLYLRFFITNFVGNGSALLIRREALENVGGYDPTLNNCADWHVQAMIAARWRVGLVPEYLTGYRVTPRGKSMNHLRMKTARIAVVERFVAAYPETPARARALGDAVGRARLAVVRLRRGEVGQAVREMATSLRASPRAALEIFFVEEGGRLTRKAFRRALLAVGLLRGAPPGPRFLDVDPADQLGRRPAAPLPWALRELERDEEAFLARSQSAGTTAGDFTRPKETFA